MSKEPAYREMARLISGYQQSQAIYVAAKLNLADALVAGPRSLDELSQATGAHRQSLGRLLRALASIGVFTQEADGRYALTPLAEELRSDVPGSQWAFAVMMGEEHFHVWGDLFFAVETGQNAFERIYGMPIFEFLAENPEKGRIFDAAMTSIHGREMQPLLDAYDFSGIETLADIGGGNGSVLLTILERHPHLHGVLFDLAPVIHRTREFVAAAKLENRCELVAGDFFQSVVAGADAYLLRHIIHDWDDEKATRILRHIHRAMRSDGRVLVLETVLAPGNEPSFAKFLDLTMMLLPGGQERDEDEYRQLFAAAGFRLAQTIPTNGPLSILVAQRA